MLSDGFRTITKSFNSVVSGASLAANWPTVYTCFHMKPTASNNNLRVINLYDVSTVQLRFNMTTAGFLNVYRGDNTTLLATGTIPMSVGVWYWIAMKIVFSNTVGIVQTKIGNVTDINLTNVDTCATANEYGTHIFWGGSGGAAFNFDNWHLYNGADAAPWNAISDVERRVYFFMPNADGPVVDWTPSAGSEYQCIDEIPPNGDTDYIKSSTLGNISVFDKADLSNIATVDFVQVWACARKDDAATRGIKIVARDGAGTYNKSAEFLTNSAYQYYQMGWLQDPVAAAAWTPTTFNAYTFGVEVST
jgi:hypothetical protein